MTELGRRNFIAIGATIAAAGVSSKAAASAAIPVVVAPMYAPAPLPFNAGSITGLSEKLLTSHHDNNYAGAVKRLGLIQQELGKLDFSAAPGFMLNGLKREELIALNSMTLYETYFAGFSGDAIAPSAGLNTRIEKDFGSLAQWKAEFAALGKALGGGSGWALLTWSPRAGRLLNTWAADHTMTAADGCVLLALDMYEHAYAMDFGAKAAAYVDAVMGALKWNAANEKFKHVMMRP